MEYFAAYAPESNPAEYAWNQTDRALSDSAPENLSMLKAMRRNMGAMTPEITKASLVM